MSSPLESVAFHLSGLQQRLRGKRREDLVVDPVCNMQVDPLACAGSRRYGDEEFFFCSKRCAQRFEQDPARYTPSPAVP